MDEDQEAAAEAFQQECEAQYRERIRLLGQALREETAAFEMASNEFWNHYWREVHG